jgi:hypothetical protein
MTAMNHRETMLSIKIDEELKTKVEVYSQHKICDLLLDSIEHEKATIQTFECRMTFEEFRSLLPLNKPILRSTIFIEKDGTMTKLFSINYQINNICKESLYYSYDLYKDSPAGSKVHILLAPTSATPTTADKARIFMVEQAKKYIQEFTK